MTLASLDRFTERLVTRRFFYGWTIVAVNFLTSMVTGGIGTYGLSFFVIPMAETLGVSRGAFSSVSLFRLLPLFIVPYLGGLADRKHGARWMLAVGGVVAGLALIGTSRVNSLWQFYAAYGVVYGLANIVMGGQLVGPTVLSKWFVRMRGRAMAIGTMGISAGGLLIAPLAGWLIVTYDWRAAWVVLGLVIILSVSPLGAIIMRRQPEDIGLLPDGLKASGPTSGGAARSSPFQDPEYPWTVREAVKTPALWLLVGVNVLTSLSLSSVLIHQVAYIRDKGFEPGAAAAVATTLAFAAVIAKLPWGFLAEHVHVRWLTPCSYIPAGLSLLLLVWAADLPVLYVYAVLHGLTFGGYAALSNVAWATYFGRRHMGAIRGFVTPISTVMGAFSPVLAGLMWDRLGSYTWPFTMYSAAWVVAGALMLLARPPRPPAPVTRSEERAASTRS